MGTGRPFFQRCEARDVGEVRVNLSVEGLSHPRGRLTCTALVDTGAVGLVLPAAWRDRLGALPEMEVVDLEIADQRVVTAEVRGPVRIQLDGFRRVVGEVILADMLPRPDGSFEPLVGYTILELCNVVIDMRRHCLVARKYYPLKGLRSRTAA